MKQCLVIQTIQWMNFVVVKSLLVFKQFLKIISLKYKYLKDDDENNSTLVLCKCLTS